MNPSQAQRRGRSRFSKVLPLPPPPPPPPMSNTNERAQHILTSKISLPAFSSVSTPKMSAMAILRRPVGGNTNPASPKKNSIASVSSVYSDSPGFSDNAGPRDSLSGVDSEIGPPPRLPPKDPQRQFPGPNTPSNVSASPTSPASSFTTSPQSRQEIWRRRSVKSDKGIKFPELKLQRSNGSTASPPSQQQQERSLPETPPRLPQSKGSTGPIPARPPPAQPAQGGLMGLKPSKLKSVMGKRKPVGDSSTSKSDGTSQLQSPYLAVQNRLPTPEYLKSDKEQPLTPQVLSPHTPPNEPPQLPQKSESRSTTLTSDTAATVVPNLLTSHSHEPSETLTISSQPEIFRSPQPKKTYATKILTPQSSPPVPLQSPLSPRSMRRSSGAYFPTLPSPPAAEGTILPAPPIEIVHLNCYQQHQFVKRSRNDICPVECMICQKGDMEMQWKCSWCCLRSCGDCMQVLSSIPGKSLKVALEKDRG